jgi:hypothetical protein
MDNIKFLVIETKFGVWHYAIHPGDNVYEKLKTYGKMLAPGSAMSYKYVKYDEIRRQY